MDMQQIMRQIQGMGGGMGGPQVETATMDTAEQVEISSLALLKMLKHGTFFQRCTAAGLCVGDSTGGGHGRWPERVAVLPCNNNFKTEEQWLNHEKSKKLRQVAWSSSSSSCGGGGRRPPPPRHCCCDISSILLLLPGLAI